MSAEATGPTRHFIPLPRSAVLGTTHIAPRVETVSCVGP